jgi:glycosyltransferase 2 family protein
MGEACALGLVTAVVALATVGGFVSFLPGGLGSREWILMVTLGAALGSDRAADGAVAALVLRVVWVVAELIGAAFFWLLDRQCKKCRGVTG